MDNKVVLITGASKGLGRACAIEFAKQGYNVVINYNSSKDNAEEVKSYIEKEYAVKAISVKCDISKENEVIDMVETTINEFGYINVLVNNAGIDIEKPFEEKEVEDFIKILQTNIIGTFLVTKYVSKYMMKRKSGRIINVSSTSGTTEFSPFSLEYNASKAAIVSLTHDCALQFQPYINVNAIAPGWIDTEMNRELSEEVMNEEKEKTFVKRIASAEEIAKTVVFLGSDDAGYINGEIIKIDGGRQ